MPKPEAAAKINFSKPLAYHYWPKLGAWYESSRTGWWVVDPNGNWLGWHLPGEAQPVPDRSRSRQIQLKLRSQDSQSPRLLGGELPSGTWNKRGELLRRYPGYARPSLIYRRHQGWEWSFGVPRLWASFDWPRQQLRIVSDAFISNTRVWQRRPNIQAWVVDWLDWYAHYLLRDPADDAKIPALFKLLEVGDSNLTPRFRQTARQHLAAELAALTRPSNVREEVKSRAAMAAKCAWWGVHSEWLLEILEGLVGAPAAKVKLFSPATRVLIDQLRLDNRMLLGLDLAWFDNFLPINRALASQLTSAEAKTKLVRVLSSIKQNHRRLGVAPAAIPEAKRVTVKSFSRQPSITSLTEYGMATRLGI